MLVTLVNWLLTYKYLVLFPAAILEGPIITIIVGSLCASGQMDFLTSYFIIVAGDLTGDSLYYSLGRFGRNKFISKWGHRIGLHEKRISHIDRHFLNHAGKTLILGKVSFSMEVPIIIAAGIARFSYTRFMLYMVTGALPKTLMLLLIGYFFGYSISNAHRDVVYATRVTLGIVLILILFLVVRHIHKSRTSAKTKAPAKMAPTSSPTHHSNAD